MPTADSPGRDHLRTTFDSTAELYHRARPSYPAALFDDLASNAHLSPGSRVLEIGCGTGQATLPLARLGCEIVAVELGPQLAAVARRTLAAFPNVTIHVAAFEDWPLPTQPFDAVVSATAFHWLDPAIRVTKTAQALILGGVLATIETHHIAGGTASFFDEVQRCYERHDPATPPGLRLPSAASIPQDSAELDRSGLFGPATFHRYEWDVTYSTAAYLDVLNTYSGHLALPTLSRTALLDCIATLIDTRYAGTISKRYLAQLRLAPRIS